MRKRIVCYTLALFTMLSALYLPFSLMLQSKSDAMQRSKIVSNEEKLADVTKAMMSAKVSRLISDLFFISDSLRLSSIYDSDLHELQQEWIAFANRKKVYDQIRYLDLNGNEIVRINYAPAGSYAAAQQSLQNKKDRAYFTDTIGLQRNQIYISKLDLNVENNQIEQPIKPMLRLSTPYFGTDGSLQGIIILNYSACDILDQVEKLSTTSLDNVYLLNAAGYWLYNKNDSSKEWAFMYPKRTSTSFAAAFPDEWQAMQTKNQGDFITTNGFLSYTRVFADNDALSTAAGYSIILGDGDYFIVSHITSASPNGTLFTRTHAENAWVAIRGSGFVYLLLALLALSLAIFLSMRQAEKERIKYFSKYDTMTGIYNRRAGFARMAQLYQELRNSNLPMSLCFIDINGLKEVNDYLGHEVGDVLILTVVDAIRSNIRSNDFLARLGGDEFIIVFYGLDEMQAEEIWTRISQRLQQINDTEHRPYMVSASHGIETMHYSGPDYIDTIVNRADEKMYSEKRIIKQNLCIIRDDPMKS